jgi:hypothetical protein
MSPTNGPLHFHRFPLRPIQVIITFLVKVGNIDSSLLLSQAVILWNREDSKPNCPTKVHQSCGAFGQAFGLSDYFATEKYCALKKEIPDKGRKII